MVWHKYVLRTIKHLPQSPAGDSSLWEGAEGVRIIVMFVLSAWEMHIKRAAIDSAPTVSEIVRNAGGRGFALTLLQIDL